MTTKQETIMTQAGQEVVRTLIGRGSPHVVILHVSEDNKGAALPIRKAIEQAGIAVHSLNQAYANPDFAARMGNHRSSWDAASPLFKGEGLRAIYLTGWGSDPKAADRILTGLYPYVASHTDMRLILMNNASPVPHMFTQGGPTAHPTASDFAAHVASLLSIGPDRMSVFELEIVDPC